MLSATDFYTVTPLLNAVLWIEAVIYLSIGVYEIFDDFKAKPPAWAKEENGYNAWIRMQDVIGRKMHAAICTILGFVALNGALEGFVTRFELELIFISFAVIMPVIWAMIMPGRLGFMVVLLKPEFYLQIVMFVFFSHLIRPEILVLCVALNLWGLFVHFRLVRTSFFQPFTYQSLRSHIVRGAGADYALRIDKLAGRRSNAASDPAADLD
jgi:hypothetical protein